MAQLICFVAYAQESCTPPQTRAWLWITADEFRFDTLWFGFDSTATYCIDTHLCEYEIPWRTIKKPPAMVAFEDIRGDTCFGNGSWLDFRPYYARAQIDTHMITYGASWQAVFKFRWSRTNLLSICDSVRLVDIFGGIRYNLRMDLLDSLDIPRSLSIPLFLIRYGAKQILVDVNSNGKTIPSQAGLSQNYPNPFNPITTIRYELPRESYVTLKVFDVLGREVATLVDRRKPAGRYEVEWDAESRTSGVSTRGGHASGVYFYLLKAGDFIQSKKLTFMR
ncbi:MAG: T9SS type A sorting domain-containing protein [Ignavibacteriae bacterium]|nr:T9SS type A sorting domain-containing protein [Ignavibacteriota bacterium]